MKRLREYILAMSVMAMAAVTGVSCSSEVPPDTQEGKTGDNISLCFTLSTGKPNITRAYDEPGNDDETYIDMENFKILVFGKDRILRDVLYDDGLIAPNTFLWKIDRDTYRLQTRLDQSRYNPESEFAVVVLANWRSAGDDTKLSTDWAGHKIDSSEIGLLSIDDLKEMTLTINPDTEGDQPDSWMPGYKRGIPMFGSRYTSLKDYDKDVYGETNPMMIPDIDLVRAISKIEITNLDAYGPEITSMTLEFRNQTGYLMQDYDFSGFTHNVTAATDRGGLKPSVKGQPFHQEDNRYIVYIPEIGFENNGQRQIIRVCTDVNGMPYEKWIYLAPYDSYGSPLLSDNYSSDWSEIKRNYIYRYSIDALSFKFLVNVAAWKFGGKVHINLEPTE